MRIKTQPAQGRRGGQNIVRQAAVITAEARCSSITEAFRLFLTQSIVIQVVQETNREGDKSIYEWNLHPESPKEWKDVDETEIYAWIGLCILAGIQKLNFEPVLSLWSNAEGRPIFRAVMLRDRFQATLECTRFDNRNTRDERLITDKLAAFSDIWNMFQAQLPKMYIPGPDLCVDEQLVVYRGCCRKPAKYGVKIWWPCDSETSYPLKGQVYTGRRAKEQQEVVSSSLSVTAAYKLLCRLSIKNLCVTVALNDLCKHLQFLES